MVEEAVVTGMAEVAVVVATVTVRLLVGAAAAAIAMVAVVVEDTASAGETSISRGLVDASKDAWPLCKSFSQCGRSQVEV